jgi:flagellar basal-body rod modification protein FlgD
MDELLGSAGNLSSSARASLDQIQASSNPSQSESAGAQLAEDFDTFLLLLTTQLENQDPTEPLDTNEFTNQIVAFTGVEQAIKTNENLEEMIGLQNSSTLSSAVNYVGQFVDAAGNAGQLSGGLANFAYELDIPAARAEIIVTDSAGRAVFQGEGPTGSGKQRVTWDGTNSFTGAQEPDGTYNIFVTATNSSGETMDDFYRTFTTGPVTGAEVINGSVILNVAGTNVPLSDVTAIRQPVVSASTGTNVASNDNEPEALDETSIVEDVVDGVTEVVEDIVDAVI